MSHTGRVHEGGDSPGIIQVITTGYVVNDNNVLEFRKPSLVPYDTADKKKFKTLKELELFQAQERFILFLSKKGDNLFELKKHVTYGLGVNFNIKFYKNYKKSDKWKNQKWDKNVGQLELKVNQLLGMKNFQFRYIADEVELLSEKFVLYHFFELMKPLNYRSFGIFVDKIKFTEEFHYRYQHKIECIPDSGKPNRSINATNDHKYEICNVRIRSAEEFDHLYGAPETQRSRRVKNSKIKVCSNVIEEIKNSNRKEHSKSSPHELPTIEDITNKEC